VLIAHRYDWASTNRIAAAAGISPGSLYQYFPNKDRIGGHRALQRRAGLQHRCASESLGEPAPRYVRNSIAALLDALDVHPQFLRAVIEHTPRLGSRDKLGAFEQRIGELAYLTLNRTQLRRVVARQHRVVDAGLDGRAPHDSVCAGPAPIGREEFLEEITRLALSYLAPARDSLS